MIVRVGAKRLAVRLATSRVGQILFYPLISDQLVIFMLHRFRDAERGIGGHDPAFLRFALGALRRDRVPLLPLREALQALRRGERRRGVSFTVDDGYDDFHTIGGPLFEEYDCPVTVFVTTGFLDTSFWFWWDKVQYALSHSPLKRLSIQVQNRSFTLRLEDFLDRRVACETLVAAVKDLPQDRRSEAVEGVLGRLAVDVPSTPPPEFAPMTWQEVEGWAVRGVDFAPHSVTHPSLSTLSEGALALEIRESFDRVRSIVSDPAPIFCYPYGNASDVSESVFEAVRAEGLSGAVTAIPNYVGGTLSRDLDFFRLPRFAFPDQTTDFRQIIYGMERFKTLLRRRRGTHNRL